MIRINLDNFLKKAKLVHSDKYDYSKVIYINSTTKVCIICPEHGEFWQTPNNHLMGKGCIKCKFKKISMGLEKFIKKAKHFHGDKFDYSKVIYVNNGTKVCIICPEHGEFWQTPTGHLRNGCYKCSKVKKLNTDEFIERANKIHNNKYDYSKVVYKNSYTKVCIICPEHGEFWQTPAAHFKTGGCHLCGYDHAKLGLEQFKIESQEIHKNKYDYSKVVYQHSKSKVCIICPEHGEFLVSPDNHIHRKQGCPKCALKILKKDDFILRSKLKHNKFDYSKVEYNGAHIKVCIICPEHGEFWQTPDNHWKGKGCPKCFGNISKMEENLQYYIKQNYDGKIETNKRNIINPYELDIFLPDLKLAFEFNGLYWHSELYKDKNYHKEKTEACEKQGIHLVQIYEDDWIFKQEIVKSRILNLLGKSNKLYARNCQIKEISFKDAKEFLESNHLQGSCVDKVRLGLYCENELVSLMTFGKLRKNLGQIDQEGSWELLRFCNKLNFTVVGGADRLFNYFIKKYEPQYISSYADRSWTMNNNQTLYDKLGFCLNNLSQPNYFYINNMVRENRFKYRKDQLIKQGFDPNKSEHEIMLERGLFRIYDSGCIKYSFRMV